MANSIDPDDMAPTGAISSGYMLFANISSTTSWDEWVKINSMCLPSLFGLLQDITASAILLTIHKIKIKPKTEMF